MSVVIGFAENFMSVSIGMYVIIICIVIKFVIFYLNVVLW